MRKLEIADPQIMQVAIQQEIERSEESRYDHRLHGVLLVSSGYSCTEVGQLFGQAATTVQRWVQRFERGGNQQIPRNQIQEASHSGRTRKGKDEDSGDVIEDRRGQSRRRDPPGSKECPWHAGGSPPREE